MYALTAQILKERSAYKTLDELAAATMALWKKPDVGGELRLDEAYQDILPEFHRRKEALRPKDVPDCFNLLFGS